MLTLLYEAKVDPDILARTFSASISPRPKPGGHRREPGRRPRLVLRDQGATGRATLRARHRQNPPNGASGTFSWEDVQPGPAGNHIEIGGARRRFHSRRPALPIKSRPPARGRSPRCRVESRHELGGARVHHSGKRRCSSRCMERDAAEMKATMVEFDERRSGSAVLAGESARQDGASPRATEAALAPRRRPRGAPRRTTSERRSLRGCARSEPRRRPA